jgi:hypothetical protein
MIENRSNTANFTDNLNLNKDIGNECRMIIGIGRSIITNFIKYFYFPVCQSEKDSALPNW